METLEIKRKLIDEINSSNNKDLLEEFYHFSNLENKMQEPYKLSDEQKLMIEEARVQIKKGDYLTNQEANENIDKWLYKNDFSNIS